MTVSFGFLVWSVFDLATASGSLAVTESVGLMLVWTSLMAVTPSASSTESWPPSVKRAYQKYFAAIAFPFGAADIGRALNALRLCGLALVPFAAFNRLWWQSAVLAAVYFLSGSTCVRLNPRLYLGSAAAKGSEFALQELQLLSYAEELRRSERPAGDDAS